jgi:methionine aminotransferase
LGNFYQEKRDYLRALLKDTPLVRIDSHGSYFESYSYAAISEDADKIFAEKLVTDFGIAVIPMSAFYHDATDHKVIRLCFAKQNTTLEAAAACLQKLNS